MSKDLSSNLSSKMEALESLPGGGLEARNNIGRQIREDADRDILGLKKKAWFLVKLILGNI